ncbi:DUF6939 family protein [Mucilaginibacter flavus]|uniref:DUF6939 family protein n=1 Tax=Mucilaginibacter flavus TaxID=931504 RepID=UPI0025B57239|nr:hypothetical protein [Mucilaginibacter flavus]MDN3585011.1 hypothetical protein [Mucilaginibacter flavus]
MIYVDSRKKSEKTLAARYPNAKILDVTSKATTSLVKLSPFYPHSKIPVPFSDGMMAESVEGIWQGLKVFEGADVDKSVFENKTMKNLKRTVRKFGKPLGHRKGFLGKELLSYIDARIEIYLPTYLWVLENKVGSILEKLKDAAIHQDIVLLDYETNCDVLNYKKPLSHAFLVKSFVDGNYPKASELYKQFNNQNGEKKENTQVELKNDNRTIRKKIDPNQNTLF